MTANLNTPEGSALLLSRAEAAAAVGCKSSSALHRWARKFGVRSFRQGQWRRSDLNEGMAREERVRAANVRAIRRKTGVAA